MLVRWAEVGRTLQSRRYNHSHRTQGCIPLDLLSRAVPSAPAIEVLVVRTYIHLLDFRVGPLRAPKRQGKRPTPLSPSGTCSPPCRSRIEAGSRLRSGHENARRSHLGWGDIRLADTKH